MTPVRTAILSPQPIVAAGVASLLRRFPDKVELVKPPDGPEHPDPDVVVFDAMALLDGDDKQLRYLVERTYSRILVIARDLRPDLGAHALRAGADGFVSLGVTPTELIDAVVRAGNGWEPDGEAGRPAERRSSPQSADLLARWAAEAGLTAREAEVLELIAHGRSNADIATELVLSPNSIKTYTRAVYRKIAVSSRAQATHWAFRHGFRP